MRLIPTLQTPAKRRLFSALFMWFFMMPLAGNAAGIVWSPATGLPQKALTATFNSIRFINGQFFAIGNSGIIISSSDGNTWNDRNPVTTDIFQDIGWKSGSGYVVVGDNALSLSIDGRPPWNDQIISHALPVPQMKGIAANDTKFVAVGSTGRMWNSQDGQNWTINDDWPTGVVLRDVNWNGSQFVAVGQSGTILVGDGTGSGSVAAGMVPPGSPTLNAIAWSNALQKYVAVGTSGNIWISSGASAATWSFVSGQGLPSVTFSGVTEGNGQFVAVGNGGNIVASAAGQNWLSDTSGTANALTGVAWGNGRFIAVGNGGTVLVGLPSLAITTEALQNGAPVTTVAVGDSFQYRITVKNNSAAAISSLSLTDTLPVAVAYTSINPGLWQNCSPPPNSTINCTLGTLAANTIASITINVSAPSTVGAGSITNDIQLQAPGMVDVLDSLTIGLTITGGGGTNFPLTGSGGGGAGSYFMLVLLCLACLAVWLRRNQMTQSCRKRV